MYISLLLFITALSHYPRCYFPKCACAHVCTHTHLSLYFYSVWLLGNSVYMAFLGWWPYKSFESQLVFWTFEMLTARKPSHFWKTITNTELYWKRSQTLMENINVIQKSFSFVYKKYFFVPNSYMWLHFFSSCRCPLPRKWWLKC